MQNIHVHRYRDPEVLPEGVAPITDSWQGYIEPDDASWILFVDAAGAVSMFDERDPITGAVIV